MQVPFTINGLTIGGNGWSGHIDGLGGAGTRYASGGRTQADGQWSTAAYLSGKALGLSGTVRLGSAGEYPSVLSRLNRALAVRSVPLTVHWPSGDQTIRVRRDGDVQITDHSDRLLSWSVTMVADDPLWYAGGPAPEVGPVPGVEFPSNGWQVSETGLPLTSGGMHFPFAFPFAFDAETVSGDLQVSSDGSGWWLFQIIAGVEALVDPRLVVVGPDGVLQRLVWSLTLQPGESLTIDPQRRASLLQGTASRPPLVREWPTIRPGTSVVQFRAATDADARLKIFFIPSI